MAFVLTITGILMIVTGAKGTYAAFGNQVISDFTGPGNFTYWVAALGAVGSLGYVQALRTFSTLFMSLILIVMVLSNKGFFAQFTAALKTGPIAPPASAANSSSQSIPGGNVPQVQSAGAQATPVKPADVPQGAQSLTDTLSKFWNTYVTSPAY